uniref:Uncharacterized protein n=1 Tax=Oryza brachyantha TaxID=4533 RepID=J3LDI8_ORYBR
TTARDFRSSTSSLSCRSSASPERTQVLNDCCCSSSSLQQSLINYYSYLLSVSLCDYACNKHI